MPEGAAVSVVVSPRQMVLELALADTVGNGFTVMVNVLIASPVPSQLTVPFIYVGVTVKVTVCAVEEVLVRVSVVASILPVPLAATPETSEILSRLQE